MPVDEIRLHAVSFGPCASETHIHRCFIFSGSGTELSRVRRVPSSHRLGSSTSWIIDTLAPTTRSETGLRAVRSCVAAPRGSGPRAGGRGAPKGKLAVYRASPHAGDRARLKSSSGAATTGLPVPAYDPSCRAGQRRLDSDPPDAAAA